MVSLVALLAALHGSTVPDSARLVGSTLVVEPVGLSIALPPEWFGAKTPIAWPPSCGHEVRGLAERRLVTARAMLDSLPRVSGEWDREYAAVADSTLPVGDLVAQLGPEELGGGSCFADLQVRVYVSATASTPSAAATTSGLRAARGFFPSATLVSRDSASWHIDRISWDAWYHDYGGEANIELFTTVVRGRAVTLVFMRATIPGGPAERDQRFVLDHVRLMNAAR